MKSLVLIICSSFWFSMMAQGACEKFPVHLREKPNSKIEVRPTCLKELEGKDSFENKDIKVVLGTEKKAILKNNKKYLEKAATVFYHTNKAIQYFRKSLGQNILEHMGQLTIRLDMERSFLEIAHFGGEHLPPQYNNALTIPPSNQRKLDKYDPWGFEVWYRPGKTIKIPEPLRAGAESLEGSHLQESSLIMGLGLPLSRAAAEFAESGDLSSIELSGHLDSVAFTFGIFFILPKIMKIADGHIKTKVFLETSLIPEIIYHEFAHVALAKFLSPRQSTPLIEGLANYYAVQISEGTKIAHRNGDRQRGLRDRDATKKDIYHTSMETRARSQHNFAFQLLFHLKNTLPSKQADSLMFATVKKLSADSGIKYDLFNALLDSIRESKEVKSKRSLMLKINRMAQEFGL